MAICIRNFFNNENSIKKMKKWKKKKKSKVKKLWILRYKKKLDTNSKLIKKFWSFT
jgi:hypothetical protein